MILQGSSLSRHGSLFNKCVLDLKIELGPETEQEAWCYWGNLHHPSPTLLSFFQLEDIKQHTLRLFGYIPPRDSMFHSSYSQLLVSKPPFDFPLMLLVSIILAFWFQELKICLNPTDINKLSSVIMLPTIIPGLQRKTTTKYFSDAGIPLSSTFLMVQMNSVSSGPFYGTLSLAGSSLLL